MATGRVRRGWTLATSAERRKVRKYGGLSGRQYKKATKESRAYKRYGTAPKRKLW